MQHMQMYVLLYLSGGIAAGNDPIVSQLQQQLQQQKQQEEQTLLEQQQQQPMQQQQINVKCGVGMMLNFDTATREFIVTGTSRVSV